MVPRILLVDHDPCIASLLSYPLNREGYETKVAGGMQAGYEEAKRSLYHLIIYDAAQGEKEDMELLYKLRKHRIDIPVMILSPAAEESYMAHCLREGAEDYIIKPFSVELLLARIYAVLRRCYQYSHYRPIQQSESLRLRDLHIFPDRYQVSCNGCMIPLSTKEFDLLLALSRRKGDVIPRSELAFECWQDSGTKACRKTDFYISSLRKKIAPFSAVTIFTVRGRGYKIME